MERIAPLARILAEANGIEWQQLNGTGAGGMIVEQDILDYLSRVMSGEAEPPSTPVDAPPPDWTGEDLPGGGMFDAQMLSQAGVESDIADFVQQSRPAAPTLSQDDFELDDDQDDQLLAPPAAPASSSPFDIPPVTPAAPTFASGPVPTDPVPVSPGPVNRIQETHLPEPHLPEIPAVPTPAAAAPAAPASGGLGSLLSRLYQKDSDRPATPATPEPQPSSPTPSSFGSQPSSTGLGGFSNEPVTPPAPTSPFNVPPVELRAEAPQAPLASSREPVLPAPTALMTAQVDVDEVTPEQATPAPTPAPQFSVPAMPEASRFDAPAIPEQPEEVVADAAPSKAVSSESVSSEPAPVQETTAPAAAAPTEQTPEVQPAPAATPQTEPAPAAAPATPRDAVWFGTYLRRDAQVAQLHDLRQQLSEALEREVPLALLVARAAQRHAAGLGLGSVAMRDMDRGLTRQMGGEVGSSVSLRDALLVTDQDFDGTPDLLVVDAGALDMDDLHYPDTLTLSVGRVQDGRAALSLQGDVDPEKAARFLANVAQTLEKPVILLV